MVLINNPIKPPTDYHSQFLCKQLVPFNKCLISSSLRTHTHTHTQKLTRGEEIELAGCNAAPCVCNQSRLRIQGHCKSLWLESKSQRPLGEAALITRYDYSRGMCVCGCVCVCVWVGGGEICAGVMAHWLHGECVSTCLWSCTSEYESNFKKLLNGDECKKAQKLLHIQK